jgi:hypothetical protein
MERIKSYGIRYTEFLSRNFKGREHSRDLRLRLEVDLEMDLEEI